MNLVDTLDSPCLTSSDDPDSRSTDGNIPISVALEPFLNATTLCIALQSVLPKRPCARTLQRWVRKGMPFHTPGGAAPQGNLGMRSRLFLFTEVYRWLFGNPIQSFLAQETADRSHNPRALRRRRAA
jgi:hypothetical protein